MSIQTSNRSESVGVTAPRTSQVNLGNSHVTTLDFFRLQPIYTKEMLPGDTFNVNIRSLVNGAPLAQRVYGKFKLDVHAFFVPNRIIWKNWDKYYFGDRKINSPIYTHPFISNAGVQRIVADGRVKNSQFWGMQKILSGLGYPVNFTIDGVETFPINYRWNALPLRAYNQIWWDYYRDSLNIEEYSKEINIGSMGDGDTTILNTYIPRYRTLRKDYISTLLLNPQNGGENYAQARVGWQSAINPTNLVGFGGFPNGDIKDSDELHSFQAGIGIKTLRFANALQRFAERLNITGTRTIERIMALFGVKSDIIRHDMAEFVGATSLNIGVDGLVNTGSSNNGSTDVVQMENAFLLDNEGPKCMGSQQGFANAGDQSDTFSYHANEHGIFMVIASIVPEASRPYCVDRMMIRGLSTPNADRFDYYTPDFDGVSYQPVTMAEVATPSPNSGVQWKSSSRGGQFDPQALVGYQPPYEDYRISRDIVSGDFLEPTSKNTLAYCALMHDLSRLFTPNQVFAGLNLTTADERYRKMFDEHFIITDNEYDHFICKFDFVNNAVRPITSAELPTELSNLANSTTMEISKGGVRL